MFAVRESYVEAVQLDPTARYIRDLPEEWAELEGAAEAQEVGDLNVASLWEEPDEAFEPRVERVSDLNTVRRPVGPVRIVQVRVVTVEATAVETMPGATVGDEQSAPIVDVLEIGQEPVECPICSNHVREPIEYLACGHVFCRDCIHRWSRVNRVCPLCRARLQYTPIESFASLVRWSR
jgi:hypothetical protein